MKFKVGDKVRVRSLDWYNENKGLGYSTKGNYNFSQPMSEYCGMTATVIKVLGNRYYLDLDDKEWNWQDWMLEDEVVTENYETPNNNDNVNHPKHYTSHPSGVECIEITKHYDFCIGNAIKYLWRAGLKSEQGYSSDEKQIEDLKKAIWYINKKIEMLEK
jgi:hypothetical protein